MHFFFPFEAFSCDRLLTMTHKFLGRTLFFGHGGRTVFWEIVESDSNHCYYGLATVGHRLTAIRITPRGVI